MVLAARRRFLERGINGALQNTKNHGWRQVKHLATGSDLALVSVIGNLTVYQQFTMIDTAGPSHIRVGHILCQQRVVPQLTGFIRQVAPQSSSLIAGEKRRKTLRAHTKVQMTYFHLGHFCFAKRAGCHGFEYS